jgi:hypothetical protein
MRSFRAVYLSSTSQLIDKFTNSSKHNIFRRTSASNEAAYNTDVWNSTTVAAAAVV